MRANIGRLLIPAIMATLIILGADRPALASFGANQLSGSGGLKVMGDYAGTKIFATVFVEYYELDFANNQAHARVTARVRKGNDLALLYCDNFYPPTGKYCYKGSVLGLQPILVPIDDIPGAQQIIMGALKTLILQKFFNGEMSRTLFLKAVSDGIDTTVPLFNSAAETSAYCNPPSNPGCMAGTYPLYYPHDGNVFVMDIEGAVD